MLFDDLTNKVCEHEVKMFVPFVGMGTKQCSTLVLD